MCSVVIGQVGLCIYRVRTMVQRLMHSVAFVWCVCVCVCVCVWVGGWVCTGIALIYSDMVLYYMKFLLI